MRFTKSLKSVVFLAVVITASFIGYKLFFLTEPVVKERVIERHLTQEEKNIYQDKIDFDLKQIEGFKLGKNQDTLYRYKIYMDLGFQYYGLGLITQAEKAYKDANQQAKTQHGSFVALYTLYLETNENDKALAAINQAISLVPDNPDVWKKLIELQKDRFPITNDELNNLFLEAIKSTKEHADILKVYAEFLETIGEYKKAWELWNLLSNYEPKNLLYKNEMDRLGKILNQQ